MAQYNKPKAHYAERNNDVFEVVMLADVDGHVVGEGHPLPVTFSPSAEINGFASFNNFGLVNHKGFTVNDAEIPVFAVRVKPGSAKQFYIVDYKIVNNSADASIVGYQWYNFKTVGGAYTWVDIGTSSVQYAIFHDANATPNTFTHDEPLHSGTVVGKDATGLTASMSQVPFTDGGMTLILTARRLDSSTKLDFWFNVTAQL
jgi:hypothetical protein